MQKIPWFCNLVSCTSQSTVLLFARPIICKHRILDKCYSIVIEKDTETFRKMKKRTLMCKLIIFLPFCYFSFKQGGKFFSFEKLSLFLVSARNFLGRNVFVV